jgi:hypothetical protein
MERLTAKQTVLPRTDHQSLTWVHTQAAPTGMIARWLEVVANFDFRVLHRAKSWQRGHTGQQKLSRHNEVAVGSQIRNENGTQKRQHFKASTRVGENPQTSGPIGPSVTFTGNTTIYKTGAMTYSWTVTTYSVESQIQPHIAHRFHTASIPGQ